MNKRTISAARLKVPVPPQSTKPAKPKPEWNSELAENPHKISRAELLQKKLNSKSKNESAAKEQLHAKLELLKQGKVPKEYKPITQATQKKFNSKEAFLRDK